MRTSTSSELTDGELMMQLGHGDNQSLGEIYVRYASVVRSAATYTQARVASVALHAAVAQESMPPFPAQDAECRKLVDARNMSEAERAVLEAWVLAGTVEGDPNQPSLFTVPTVPQVLGAPDMTIDLGMSYVAVRSDLPHHRCFVVDPGLTAYTSLTAVGVLPSNARALRRALVHLALPGSELELAALESEDAAPGYDCYYGGRFQGSITLADDMVGASRFAFPNETAVTVPPGSRFVLELDEEPGRGADNPSLALWREEVLVDRAPSTFFVANTTFVIPAGAPSFIAQATGNFVSSDTTPAAGEARAGTLWGVGAHMHLRGKSAKIELLRANGDRECLLSVPAFSVEQAGGYRFAKPVHAAAGDKVIMRCEWDNSPERQPVVNGMTLPARDLTIGSGVLDETCVGSLLMTED